MNRRELITRSAGAVAIACVSGRSVAGSVFNLEPPCASEWCANFLEAAAREIMKETGEWKQELIRGRAVKRMLITHRGCCGCEITLPKGASHPDWQYVRRNLTPTERKSFHVEYGQQAPFLLGLEMVPGWTIRAFILDGRQLGWNFSAKQNA